MQKYSLTQKIIKTKSVTYYLASHKQSHEQLIVKKLNKKTTWEEILQSKTFSIIKHTKSKHIAKIKEVIKDQDDFYCIMQSSDANLTKIIANDIERKDIYKISKQLLELITELWQQKLLIRDIRPSHLFLSNNKNGLKLYHFENFLQKDFAELDLHQIQDMRYISPEQILTKKGFDEKSSIFSIALIICQLITGEPLIKAKNKLEYIYQLTQLFPNERMDKMVGSQHQWKQIEKSQSFIEKMKKQEISPSFASFLGEMLKLDRSQRLSMDKIIESFDLIIDEQEKFQKGKEHASQQNATKQKPNKNQVNLTNDNGYFQIQFNFQNKPTFSILPTIFNQKQRRTGALPPQDNIQDDGIQPIIIKQASLDKKTRGNKHLKNISLHRKDIDLQSHQHLKSKPTGDLKSSKVEPPISYSSNKQLLHKPYKIMPTNQQINNSRLTKQTVSTTVKKPQLTNYALNEVNLGIKLGMNTTFFSQNQNDL